MKIVFIGLLALGSLTAFSQESYNLGCGTINHFAVDSLLAEQGVFDTYKVELEISKGIHTSSYVKGAALISRIKKMKSESKHVCMSTRYDSELETSYVDIVKEI